MTREEIKERFEEFFDELVSEDADVEDVWAVMSDLAGNDEAKARAANKG